MKENQAANNPISIYGQEGLDDFPVLKAFQQYIDAEQSKARKRMIMLCLFFGFLMTIVIVVFMIMLREADERNQLLLRDATAQNQALNDKLVEFAMKERERQPVVVQPQAPAHNPANDAAIKAMTDTLAALQKQMADQQVKMIEQQAKIDENRAKMAEEQLKAVAAAAAKAQEAATAQKATGPSKEQLTLQKQIDEDTAKLVKARALLKAEKEKIAAEKERLRREEVERQRRRLYPEYYEKKDAEEKAAAEKKQQAPAAKMDRPVSYFDAYEDDVDLDDDGLSADELDDLVPSAKPKPKAKPAAAAPAKKPSAGAKKPMAPSAAARPQAKQIKSVSAPVEAKSASGDRYVVPVEINGANSDWLIPTT